MIMNIIIIKILTTQVAINTVTTSTTTTAISTTIEITNIKIKIWYLNQLKWVVNRVRLLNGIIYGIIIIEDLNKLKMIKNDLERVVSIITM